MRSAPCTPAQCDGELCPAEGAPPCGRGESCVGVLPLGNRAVRDAEEVKDRLQQLNGKITQAAAQVGGDTCLFTVCYNLQNCLLGLNTDM